MLWLIVNPSAGDGRTGARLDRITTELTALGLDHVVHSTTSLDHARELALAASASGALVVTFGGDGLIGAVAGALAHSSSVMGILPGGRGNDIPRALGIPADPVAACQVLRDGRDRTLDLGKVGDVHFLGIVSCGLDSDANRIANASRLIRGSLAYSYGGLRALVDWKPAQFEVEIDGHSASFRGYTVAVANAPSYGGGMVMAPDAELDDALFDVVVIADMPKWRFLVNMPRIFFGSHTGMGQVSIVRGRQVRINADRPLSVYGDGELISALPVEMAIDPGAVTVRVPRN
jgi:YegS/Rv2252/BmrU family lipid kinase